MSRTQSSIGAAQNYGPRVTNEGLPVTVSKRGPISVIEVYVDYEQVNAGLPTANADTDEATITIPANSLIVSSYFYVDTAFTSGGSATLELGVQDIDGGAVDADGLDTIAVAALTIGSWTVNDGALVGATVGTADVQISIDDAVAVFTAGKGRLVVEYIQAFDQ